MGEQDREQTGEERREARAETGQVEFSVVENMAWIVDYVTLLQEATNLSFWEITVHGDWPPPDYQAAYEAGATVYRSNTYNDADMYLNPASITSREDLRYLVMHELMHLILRDYDNAIEAAEDQMSPSTWQIVSKWNFREMEGAVDFIARAWCRQLPLPPDGKGLP